MRGPLPTALLLTAIAWGFAEASLFFIVPDVLISFIALRHGLKAALTASVAAAIAAAAGGAAMYFWASLDAEGAKAAIAALPAIDRGMINAVSAGFESGGYSAMLIGAFSGVPYKIYAVDAGEAGRSLAVFLLMTPLVRLPRFILAGLIVAGINRLTAKRLSRVTRLVLLSVLWLGFYGWYFSVMP